MSAGQAEEALVDMKHPPWVAGSTDLCGQRGWRACGPLFLLLPLNLSLVGKTVTELSGHWLVDPTLPELGTGSLGQEAWSLGATLSFPTPPLRMWETWVLSVPSQNGL